MRKQVLTFTIMAAGLLVVACGNKSANAAGGADSTAVAAAPEAAKADVKSSDVKKTYEKSDFSIGAPEGWETMPNDDPQSTDIMLLKGGIDKMMKDAFVILDIEGAEGASFEEAMKEFQENTKGKLLDDVTAAGITFKHFYIEESEMPGHILIAQQNGKNISFTIGMAEVDDPDVQAILNSLKLK